MDIPANSALSKKVLISFPNLTMSIPGKSLLSARSSPAIVYPSFLLYNSRVISKSFVSFSTPITLFNFSPKTLNSSLFFEEVRLSYDLFCPSSMSLVNSKASTSTVALSFLLYAFDL